MARTRYSIPTQARLSPSLRVDSKGAIVQKYTARLSRQSLLNLALDWLSPENLEHSAPAIRAPLYSDDESDGEDEDEEDAPEDFYPRERSIGKLRQRYMEMQSQRGGKKDVADRITEGDWRHGMSLYQLAMLDLQYLYDNPETHTWSAYRVMPLKCAGGLDEPPKMDKESLVIPRFHPAIFVQRLEAQVLPDAKAHIYLDRPKDRPLCILRMLVLDSPYNTDLAVSDGAGEVAGFDSSRTIMVAFPDASPFIYISKPQTIGATAGSGDSKNLRDLIIEGIPRAFSRPPQRYTLRPTSMVTKNLDVLLVSRGPGRENAAGGGWSSYADEKKQQSPLNTILPTAVRPQNKRELGLMTSEERAIKRARVSAQARFGDSAKIGDGKGLERLDITMQDPFSGTPSRDTNGADDDGAANETEVISRTPRRASGAGRKSRIDAALAREGDDEDGGPGDGRSVGGTEWVPDVRMAFHGTHVFAGIRQLVEAGIIDGKRMPGWLTGEEGVTVGAVRNGRIRGHKGSGM